MSPFFKSFLLFIASTHAHADYMYAYVYYMSDDIIDVRPSGYVNSKYSRRILFPQPQHCNFLDCSQGRGKPYSNHNHTERLAVNSASSIMYVFVISC